MEKQTNAQPSITTLNIREWHQYKEFRLKAIKQDPQAFIIPYEEEVKTSDEEWQKRLQNYQGETAVMLFAQDKNAIVGMIGAYWNDENDIEKTAHLLNVYVDPPHRGRGLAKSLMENIFSYIKSKGDIHLISLRVNVEDEKPLQLYKKVGFIENGRTQIKTADGLFHEKVLMKMRV